VIAGRTRKSPCDIRLGRSRGGYAGCVQVSIELSSAEVAWIDRAVANGLFESREAAIKGAINGAIGSGLDDAAIAEAYRRGYEAHPEDEQLGELGLRLLGESIQRP
jgi:Arc/MetJ-type ribon-helix-helix transcriptional regulator